MLNLRTERSRRLIGDTPVTEFNLTHEEYARFLEHSWSSSALMMENASRLYDLLDEVEKLQLEIELLKSGDYLEDSSLEALEAKEELEAELEESIEKKWAKKLEKALGVTSDLTAKLITAKSNEAKAEKKLQKFRDIKMVPKRNITIQRSKRSVKIVYG